MPKITNFTWSEFWDAQTTYNDMMCDIEERALEIAKDLGEKYLPHQLTDIFFDHDQVRTYVTAEFKIVINGVEEYEYFKFNSDWLFSDDYKMEIDAKEAARKIKEAEEYREYLRLKKKFEEN